MRIIDWAVHKAVCRGVVANVIRMDSHRYHEMVAAQPSHAKMVEHNRVAEIEIMV